ncbi:MAG TPA: hypothetical protein PLY57_12405, partial [Deltaproteobacteria bacterium]|jgi:hypothetical protein|nr:hypothetical protein [Deltaproteobacteria bacterium]
MLTAADWIKYKSFDSESFISGEHRNEKQPLANGTCPQAGRSFFGKAVAFSRKKPTSSGPGD